MRPRDRAITVFLVALAVRVLASPCQARASTLAETRGFGMRAMSMGGAFTAVSDDVSAVYYNPAGLAQISGHHLHIEYLFVAPRVYIKTSGQPRRVFLDKWTQTPMIAMVTDLTHTVKIPRRLMLGFGAYFPDNFKSAWKVRYGSLRYDPYYPLYGHCNEEEGVAIWASCGFALFPCLLVGAGFNFMLHAKEVGADVTFSTALKPIQEKSSVTLDITTEIFPLVGVLVRATDRLRLGFAWRHKGELLFGGGGGIELLARLYQSQEHIVPLPLSLKLPIQSHFRPSQYAIGMSYWLGNNVLLALDCTVYDWRPYKDDAERKPEPTMKIIAIPRIGLEYSPNKVTAVRVGYSFQTSPLRQQRPSYHTNLIDNDVHTISCGLGLRLRVWKLPRNPLDLSLLYQIHILTPRTFLNVHPGQPALTSSGLFHSFGVGAHILL